MQYNLLNEDTFLLYLKKVKRKFHKFIIFLDRAVQHYRSRKIKRHLSDNSNNIKFESFPK
jgi:hypothetical protein